MKASKTFLSSKITIPQIQEASISIFLGLNIPCICTSSNIHKHTCTHTHTLCLSHTHAHMTISPNGQCLVYRPLPVILPNCRLFMTITYFSSSVLSIFTPCFSLLCDKVRSVSSTKQQDNFNSQFFLITNRNITYFIYIRHVSYCINELEK